jgi:hypothetical protein
MDTNEKWGGKQDQGDGTIQDYMTSGNYGIMGSDEGGWIVVYASDGGEVSRHLLHRAKNSFETADDARAAAERIDPSEDHA